MGNVPMLRFKEFEGAWEEVQLGEIVSFRKGKGIAKKDISDIGDPCILYGELYTKYNEVIDKIQSRTDVSINNPIIGMVNDVLIPASGETALDIATASSLTVDDVLIGGDINLLTPKEEVNGLFISYQINNKQKNELAKFAEGASVVHLYKDGIRKLRIYLPIHKEQVKISEFFKLMSEKIKRQQEKIELLKEQKKGYMQKIFNRELRFKDENDDDFSKWEKYKLGEVIEEYILKTTEENQYPILSSTNSGLFLQSDYFKKQIASQSNKGYKVLKENQIVLSPQNLWMGNINYNSKFDIGIVSPSYKVFNIRDGFSNLFISYLIKTPRMMYNYKTSSEQGASIVRRNLDMNQFLDIEIYLPCLEEQKRIGNFLYLLEKRIKKNQTLKDDLLQQKKSLMQKMFI